VITREEIVNKAEKLRVHTSHVQRDYIHGWVLSGIYSKTDLSQALLLKGGNCFRKAYFPKARYSPDLDFATPHRLADDHVRASLNIVCDYVNAATGVTFDTSRTKIEATPSADSDRSIQKARLYFKDFFGEESELVLAVRLDISNLEKVLLPAQERDLLHDYSDAAGAATRLRCLKLEELLASKLKCLIQRRHSADLYDFVNATLIRPVVPIDRAEMVRTFLRMTIFGPGPRIVRDLLVNLPFQIIRGLWNQYLVTPNDASIEYDDAVAGFTKLANELFGSMPVGSSTYAFFPPELRNPILQAGHELTVLRAVYHGIQRMVEPYSLKYKLRQDGVGREYLYVYDLTGGRSSGPGLKSLVVEGFSAIENTDVVFEPRCEVELSKAGQLFGLAHFPGSPGARGFASHSSTTHAVECPYCGKRFRRKDYSTRLNPHKDKYGNQCTGRSGFLV
jgi:predicted nucleotidyltransferase component of viral defense system